MGCSGPYAQEGLARAEGHWPHRLRGDAPRGNCGDAWYDRAAAAGAEERQHASHQLLLRPADQADGPRSEEHTSELQSQSNLVCRLLLEKKKKIRTGALIQTIARRD